MATEGKTTTSPPTMAVIGGGPGGMFVCHALETQKKELEAKGQDTSHFPIVKCFERASGAGGVWRADRTHDDGNVSPRSALDIGEEEKKDDSFNLEEDHKSKQRKFESAAVSTKTNMYSGLWTNGPKECFEFYDYTFKEHWGDISLPTHLPRKYIVEYLEGRVTKNCPDFFERYFSFRTTVKNVKYLENIRKFRVSTFDANTQKENVEFFDKCVWAAGKNGFPNIPKETWELFEEGCFPGRMFHACDTSTFKEDVQGKNVLMIGGGYSAEDLALMAIKEGVKKVYCLSRLEDSEMSIPTRWPEDKVEVIGEFSVHSVKARDITLQKVYYSTKKKRYIDCDSDDEEEGEISKVLPDIDTVIFCTGYKENLAMLDPALCECLPNKHRKMSIPEDWTMDDSALSQKVLGDEYKTMRPSKDKVVIDRYHSYPHSDSLYKGCFNIDNPNMMFVMEYGEAPIMGVEICAWMIIKTVTNQKPLPSPEEMRKNCTETVGFYLGCDALRYEMDWKYQEAMEEGLEEFSDGEISEDEWEWGHEWVFWTQGEIMCEYEYPVSYVEDPDTPDAYSEYYRCVEKNNEIDDYARENLGEIVYDTEKEKDGWRTFRDYPELTEVKSYFTGIKASKLSKPWFEMDEDEKLW